VSNQDSAVSRDSISTWVFDLDGTISDPLQGMLESVNHALTVAGRSPVNETQMRAHIGPPLETTLADFAGSDDTVLIEELVQRYRAHYKESGFALNTLYPKIPDVLQTLVSRGQRLGVCTAKTQPVATRILDHFGLLDLFDFVSGGDVGITKSQQIQELLGSGDIDKDAIMIGDRKFDLRAARDNGISNCAVTWGFAEPGELHAESPDCLVQCPSDWYGWFAPASGSSQESRASWKNASVIPDTASVSNQMNNGH